MPRLRRLKLFAALVIGTRIRALQEVSLGTLERVQKEQVAVDDRLADTKGKRESGGDRPVCVDKGGDGGSGRAGGGAASAGG